MPCCNCSGLANCRAAEESTLAASPGRECSLGPAELTSISFTNGLFQSNADAQGAGQWTNQVKAFAVNPIDPNGIIMGSAAGRMFLTRDMGATLYLPFSHHCPSSPRP